MAPVNPEITVTKPPINPMQVLGTAFTIAAQVGGAYESYAASNDTALTVPPIRAYIGTDHIEIDITIKRLPV